MLNRTQAYILVIFKTWLWKLGLLIDLNPAQSADQLQEQLSPRKRFSGVAGCGARHSSPVLSTI